jgi:hypothetical protein
VAAIDWVATGSEVAKRYKALRGEGIECAKARNKYFQQATQVHAARKGDAGVCVCVGGVMLAAECCGRPTFAATKPPLKNSRGKGVSKTRQVAGGKPAAEGTRRPAP